MTRRHSYWIQSAGFELATHAHLPKSGEASHAVLICSTVGYEATHAYRGMVYLANFLAENGIAAIRFDFACNGNSSGGANGDNLVAAWQQNILDQLEHLREAWSFEQISLLAFRTSAALLCGIIDNAGVHSLMLWEPVTQGKRFVREVRAVAQFAEDPTSDADAPIESGGFEFSTQTLSDLSALTLNANAIADGMPVLLIGRTGNRQFSEASLADRCPFEANLSKDYDRMICEPHYSEQPVETANYVLQWLSKDNRSKALPISVPEPRTTSACEPEETLFRTPANDLFGILTRPEPGIAGGKPLIVLSNSGSVNSSGPNRLYVQIARELAADGYPIVRYDLGNLGDSVTATDMMDNTPYPIESSAMLAEILDYCRQEFSATNFVLAGLCSGSHTSYHYAIDHDDADVRQLVLINPLTYYFEPGMSLDNPLEFRNLRNARNYLRSAQKPNNWRRLLTGRINYRRLVRFGFNVFVAALRNVWRRIATLWTRQPLSRMDEDLQDLAARGIGVAYVFSETDPGYWIARMESPAAFRQQTKSGHSPVTIIANANHTLSRAANRMELIRALREILTSQTSPSGKQLLQQ